MKDHRSYISNLSLKKIESCTGIAGNENWYELARVGVIGSQLYYYINITIYYYYHTHAYIFDSKKLIMEQFCTLGPLVLKNQP